MHASIRRRKIPHLCGGRIEALETRRLMARLLGIDVSGNQSPITTAEWTSAKNAGYVFAWTKATEGLTFNDSTFTNNAATAKAAGVLIGAYHFARYDNQQGIAGADSEAAHYWSIAKGLITSDATHLVPMLDLEGVPGKDANGNPTDFDPDHFGYTKTTFSQWANEWLTDIKNDAAAIGITLTPIIYTGVSFANTFLDSTISQSWPLWMANYNGQDPQAGALSGTAPWQGGAWQFWQYSSTVNVPGIGSSDADAFKGSPSDLKQYIVGSGNRWALGNRVTTTSTVDAWATNAANTTFIAVPIRDNRNDHQRAAQLRKQLLAMGCAVRQRHDRMVRRRIHDQRHAGGFDFTESREQHIDQFATHKFHLDRRHECDQLQRLSRWRIEVDGDVCVMDPSCDRRRRSYLARRFDQQRADHDRHELEFHRRHRSAPGQLWRAKSYRRREHDGFHGHVHRHTEWAERIHIRWLRHHRHRQRLYGQCFLRQCHAQRQRLAPNRHLSHHRARGSMELVRQRNLHRRSKRQSGERCRGQRTSRRHDRHVHRHHPLRVAERCRAHRRVRQLRHTDLARHERISRHRDQRRHGAFVFWHHQHRRYGNQ